MTQYPSLQTWMIGVLRRASLRWLPINNTRKKARVSRGKYLCAGFKREPHVVAKSVNKKNNVFVDHINPVGKFIDWNTFIEKLFCGEENLQVLCLECHKKKTKQEKYD